jgi:inositol transport system substrate-binding protein
MFAMIFAFTACTPAQTTPDAADATVSEETSESPVATEGTNTAAQEKIKLGISFDALVSPWLVTCHNELVSQAEAIGAEAVSLMAEGDAAKQNQQIESLIAQGCDAILCFPKDSSAIVSAIKKCQEVGIPIIMINRSVSGDVLPDVQVVADNQGMANKVLQAFADIARRDGKTYKAILLIGGLSDENAVYRKAGHDEALANNTDVIEVLTEVPTDWNLDTAFKGLQNALQAYPEADFIITPSDYLWPSIRSALEQIDRWAPIGDPKHFPVVSFDGDEVGMQYLKDGYNWGDAAQDPIVEARLAIEWAVKLIKGEKPEENIIFDPGQIITVDNWDEVAPTVWSYSMLK